MTAKSINSNEYKRLLKLQRLTSALLKAKSSNEAASIIIAEGFDALESICGDVSVIDQDTNELKHIADKGYPQEFVKTFYNIAHKKPTLTMEMLKSGKPMFIHDFNNVDRKYEFGHSFVKLTKTRSMVLLPLVVRGKIFGCLQFSFRNVQKFSDQDKNFMLNLASQCAQALDRIIALENERNIKNELDAILQNIEDAVIVRDRKGRIIFVNPAAVMLHGCSTTADLLRLSLQEYYALFSKTFDEKGNELPIEHVPFASTLKEKKKTKRTFYKVLKKTGEGKWLKITSIPIFEKNNSIKAVVNVIVDITQEKQKEDSKDEFFGIASHELKTPVTSLKAYTQLLKKRFLEKKDEETASMLQKMDLQVDKLTHLIKDLLDITKIEAGKMYFSSELFECKSLAAEIIEQTQLSTKNHTLKFRECGDVIVFTDKERIGQVISNLLSNAIKYSPEGKEIVIEIKKSKDKVQVSVQDFGIGISEKDQKHIFERYYRERNLRGDTYPGLGLGLYIASRIIKQCGGKIGVKSEKGKGSTFFFSLPRYHR